jgi:hypothetical protein
MSADEHLSRRQFTAKHIQKHLQEHHGMSTNIGSWDSKDRRDFHDNVHKYGGSEYDHSIPGGRALTHDHPDLPTRASRNLKEAPLTNAERNQVAGGSPTSHINTLTADVQAKRRKSGA